jgi:hypothetical protein
VLSVSFTQSLYAVNDIRFMKFVVNLRLLGGYSKAQNQTYTVKILVVFDVALVVQSLSVSLHGLIFDGYVVFKKPALHTDYT